MNPYMNIWKVDNEKYLSKRGYYFLGDYMTEQDLNDLDVMMEEYDGDYDLADVMDDERE